MSKSNLNFELVKSLYETLMENLTEETKKEPEKIPIVEKDITQKDKERSLKKWNHSAGMYYLNPVKFKFSLKNL